MLAILSISRSTKVKTKILKTFFKQKKLVLYDFLKNKQNFLSKTIEKPTKNKKTELQLNRYFHDKKNRTLHFTVAAHTEKNLSKIKLQKSH